MINTKYVDGLELRIRELSKKLSDEADAALQLIAESKSLKAERDALAAQVEALRDTCSYWINHAKPSGDCSKSEYNTWLALGYQSSAMTKPPQQHLAEIRAEAVERSLKTLSHRWKPDTYGDAAFIRVSELNQYADSIRKGGTK